MSAQKAWGSIRAPEKAQRFIRSAERYWRKYETA